MFKMLFPLMAGPETIGDIGGSTKEPMTADDDLKFLRSGEETPDEETTEETAEEEPETTEEESEDTEENTEEDESSEEEEEETEEEPEEDDEEEPVGALVTAKDLKSKFPDIFKKVPELKAVIYREQQYSQLFSDPKEAQLAASQANVFQAMESDLLKGDIAPLFDSLKKSDGADFDKLASNILPSLRKLDESTFMKVIAVPLKQVLRRAFSEGTRKGDKNLALSAQHLHNFVFDNTNLNEKSEFESGDISKKSSEQEKYEHKLNELDQRDHKNFKNTVDTEWLGGLHESFFQGFDPDNTLTKWTKDKLFEDAILELNKQLSSDPRHMKNMEGLWRQAKASGYDLSSKSRIVNAALARAKQIMPQVRQKLRSEALAKGGKVSSGDKKKTFKVTPKTKTGEQRPRSKNPRNTSDMSELDIIRG